MSGGVNMAEGVVERAAVANARYCAVMAAIDMGASGARVDAQRRDALAELQASLVDLFGADGARDCMAEGTPLPAFTEVPR